MKALPVEHIVKVWLAIQHRRVQRSHHSKMQHGRELSDRDCLEILGGVMHQKDSKPGAPANRFVCWARLSGVGLCRCVYILNDDGSVFIITAMIE